MVRALKSLKNPSIVFAMTAATALPGGIACLNRNILRSLDDLATETGRRLIVLSLHEAKSDRPSFLTPTVQFRGFHSDTKRFSLALLKKALTADLLVFDHVALSIPALPVTRIGLTPSVIVAHGPEAWQKVRRRSIFAYRAATKVLANSDFTLQKMQARFDGFHGLACPLGLNPDVTLNQDIPAPPDNSPLLCSVDGVQRPIGDRAFLLVGRMDPRQRGKGHDRLITALPEVRRHHPRAQLIFPGPGDGREEVAQLAHQQGVADAVFLPGFVDHQLLQSLYRQAFAFTMPSRQDGFGLAHLEAMNFGKACLGCYDDGGECVISDGVTGILVDPESGVEGIEKALIEFCRDPAQTTSMGRAGFEKLHCHFTADAFRKRFADHIRPLLRCRKSDAQIS